MSVISLGPRHFAAGLMRQAIGWYAAGLVLTAGLAALTMAAASYGPAFLAAAVAAFALMAAICLDRIGLHHPHPRFGAANAATTGRAALVCLFAGLLAEPGALAAMPAGTAWAWVGVAAAALALDGLDGWLARRQDTSSAFGARYDMEVDALLLLLLSAAIALGGKAGGWVVAIGGLRYAFVAAGLCWPPLLADLPPSFRRKLVCVVQGVALCVMLAPVIGPVAASLIGAGALAALLWSFAVDVAWLVRAGGSGRPRG